MKSTLTKARDAARERDAERVVTLLERVVAEAGSIRLYDTLAIAERLRDNPFENLGGEGVKRRHLWAGIEADLEIEIDKTCG